VVRLDDEVAHLRVDFLKYEDVVSAVMADVLDGLPAANLGSSPMLLVDLGLGVLYAEEVLDVRADWS
jgi:hypothetical protein